MEPTDAARAIRLKAIRQRAEDVADTSTAALDRRWLLAEIWTLQRERDAARRQLAAATADHERDVTP